LSRGCDMTEPIPLTILTGFLGSGKTTLLKRFLDRRHGKVGIVVNEYGEIGLDQAFFVHAAEHIELMASGCMCCARRADIAKSLHNLIQRARREGTAQIDEAVIETSGLADPAPIIATILQDPWLRNNVRLRGVVVVVDAVNGVGNVANRVEALRQLAIADTVVISKSDLRNAIDRGELEHALRVHAPDATILDAQDFDFDVVAVINGSARPAISIPAARTVHEVSSAHGSGGHATRSFVLQLDRSVDWPVFTVWLSALLHRHGDRILRVKGTVTVRSTGKPLVIHGVQHVMYPPVHLDSHDRSDRPGELVFITMNIERKEIEASLHRYLDAADKLAPPLRAAASPAA
jgi:G3E family GTPase